MECTIWEHNEWGALHMSSQQVECVAWGLAGVGTGEACRQAKHLLLHRVQALTTHCLQGGLVCTDS